MVECICVGASVGGQSVLECFLRAPWEAGVFHALVDGGRSLDPESLAAGLGERLLWVPVEGVDAMVRALDVLFRDENFGFVGADLRGFSPRELQSVRPFVWYRLQRLVHQRRGGCLLLTEQASVRCADRRLVLRQPRQLAQLDREREQLLAGMEAGLQLLGRGQVTMATEEAAAAEARPQEAPPLRATG
jgi:hypothetical protein